MFRVLSKITPRAFANFSPDNNASAFTVSKTTRAFGVNRRAAILRPLIFIAIEAVAEPPPFKILPGRAQSTMPSLAVPGEEFAVI